MRWILLPVLLGAAALWIHIAAARNYGLIDDPEQVQFAPVESSEARTALRKFKELYPPARFRREYVLEGPDKDVTLVRELVVSFQRRQGEGRNTNLARGLRKGAPDFAAELICGRGVDPANQRYAGICRSYYERAPDRTRAFADIVELKDPAKISRLSGVSAPKSQSSSESR
jgi:hypothetical protein